MAKCLNCDYPYVPKYKPCPNCGDSGSNSDFGKTGNAIVGLIGCGVIFYFLIYSSYKEFTFDEDDLIRKEFSLNNTKIEFREWDNGDRTYERTYERFGNMYSVIGTWKIENDSIILYPDNSRIGEIEKYSKEDLKDKE
jgi:hypothetical protein